MSCKIINHLLQLTIMEYWCHVFYFEIFSFGIRKKMKQMWSCCSCNIYVFKQSYDSETETHKITPWVVFFSLWTVDVRAFLLKKKKKRLKPPYWIFHRRNKEKLARSASSAMHSARGCVDTLYGHIQSSKQFFAFRVGHIMCLTYIFRMHFTFL